jgi:hypothetical protein
MFTLFDFPVFFTGGLLWQASFSLCLELEVILLSKIHTILLHVWFLALCLLQAYLAIDGRIKKIMIKESASFIKTGNVCLTNMYDAYLLLRSKQGNKDCLMVCNKSGTAGKNVSKQSVSNRHTSGYIKVKSGKFNLVLANFQPARLYYPIFDGVECVPENSEKYWALVGHLKFENPYHETLSLIAYFTTQLITGSMTSAESMHKLILLEAIMVKLPASFKIQIEYIAHNDEREFIHRFNESEIQSLLDFNKTRMNDYKALPTVVDNAANIGVDIRESLPDNSEKVELVF